MHHSVSLTTSFVKNFFPNNNLTSSSSAPSAPSSLPSQQEIIPEEPTTMNQSTTTTENVTTQVSSPINRSVEESAPTTPAVATSEPAVEEKVAAKTISAEDYRLAKFKYEQLKVSKFIRIDLLTVLLYFLIIIIITLPSTIFNVKIIILDIFINYFHYCADKNRTNKTDFWNIYKMLELNIYKKKFLNSIN